MKKYLKSFLALLIIITSAYVSLTLPISEAGIPFTAQSLVVFVVAALLTPREFLIVIASYLLLGGIGLPVFAEGSAGWDKLIGPSGGFLIGFLFSGLFISLSMNRLSRPFFKILTVMLEATLVLFLFGLGMLTYKFGFPKALEYGFHPFWIMAVVKAILATFIVYAVTMRSQRL